MPIEITMIKTDLVPVERKIDHRKMPYFGTDVTDLNDRVLTRESDISVGDKVLFHNDICKTKPKAMIEVIRDGRAYAYSKDGTGYILQYGLDDRKCWACMDVVLFSKELWDLLVKGEL